MRFSLVAACLLVSPAISAFALPSLQLPTQLSFPSFGDEDDACPDLKVRCIKDGDITNVVGDIGKQPFCRSGVKCLQCHSSKNTAQCNVKYLKDCGGGCEAYGSPI